MNLCRRSMMNARTPKTRGATFALTLAATAGLLAATVALPVSAAPAMPVAAAADGANDPMFARLSGQVGPALVKVKMILKGGMMGDQGREIEVEGTMIESDGLVLVSNALIGGMMARMGRGALTPTDVKVLIGDDTEGLTARVLARDSELDLAWVKIDDAKAKGQTFTHVDLTSSGQAAQGDRLYSVSRMGKFFGQALAVSEGRCSAVTSKPRKLIVPSATVMANYGQPAFNGDGKCVGVFVVQLPEDDDMSGGQGQGFEGPMILPASEVVAATKRAKEAPQPAEEPAGDATPAEKE
ncbi:MAG: trypsin-like peptidase domain-containing protein [Phycisphaeraceae bacterium]|nr:trypsin-like peptidase domain-containing protein [Phycisphaeraceae bacterium]